MEVPKVKDAIKRENIEVKRFSDGKGRTFMAICYKGVPLWRTIEDINKQKVFLYDPSKYRAMGEYEPYTLMYIDSYGDIYTYGQWNTLEEALHWLENPYPLY
ncbi:MAG: hypothetical protein AB7V60_04420 [Candidatus Caldatribacteriota bacterium]